MVDKGKKDMKQKSQRDAQGAVRDNVQTKKVAQEGEQNRPHSAQEKGSGSKKARKKVIIEPIQV